jgi:hypothetical protein
MKKALFCLALFTALAQVASAAPGLESMKSGRFWGKITSVDAAHQSLTVFNRKRKETAKFNWNQKTEFTNAKNPMQPQELAVGQFLMVAWEGEGDHRTAQEVAVRPVPFQKKSTK